MEAPNTTCDKGRAVWRGACALRYCAALGVLIAVACGPLPELHNPHLATVDYWPDGRLLFVATPGSGIVDVMRVTSPPRQGLDFVERLTEPARNEVVRLSVDRVRGRLWVVDHHAVYLYHLTQHGSASLFSIPAEPDRARPSTGQDAWITDLTIDDKGNAYVLLRGGALIYRVDSTTLKPDIWVRTIAGTNERPVFSDSRVLLTKDSRFLLFQSPKDGRLRRIDVLSKEVQTIAYPTPIDLSCGYLFWTDDWDGKTSDSAAIDPRAASLTAFGCHKRRVADITLDPQLRHITNPEAYQRR
jgi:hypothetical protein